MIMVLQAVLAGSLIHILWGQKVVQPDFGYDTPGQFFIITVKAMRRNEQGKKDLPGSDLLTGDGIDRTETKWILGSPLFKDYFIIILTICQWKHAILSTRSLRSEACGSQNTILNQGIKPAIKSSVIRGDLQCQFGGLATKKF